MSWFKFFFGLKIFNQRQRHETKGNKNQTGLDKKKIEPQHTHVFRIHQTSGIWHSLIGIVLDFARKFFPIVQKKVTYFLSDYLLVWYTLQLRNE